MQFADFASKEKENHSICIEIKVNHKSSRVKFNDCCSTNKGMGLLYNIIYSCSDHMQIATKWQKVMVKFQDKRLEHLFYL